RHGIGLARPQHEQMGHRHIENFRAPLQTTPRVGVGALLELLDGGRLVPGFPSQGFLAPSLGFSGRLYLQSVHLDARLGHARPPPTHMAVAREFTSRAGPLIMPMSRQLRAWMEAPNF